MAKEKDLVCGMTLNPEMAEGTSEYKGKKYYFCSEKCKKAFDKDPEKYVKMERIAHTRPHPDE